jgi:hypothetical protein
MDEREIRTKVVAAVLFIVVLGGFGGLLLIGGTATNREVRHIKNLPVLDRAAFQALAPGEDALVTGVLQGNETLVEDLVLYKCETWDRRYVGKYHRPESYWRVTEQLVPSLTLSLPGGELKTAAKLDTHLRTIPYE